MIHPADNEKVIALSVVAGEDLQQGSVLKFSDLGDGTGRMQAMKATASGDITAFGTFLAYYISPDSQDIEFVGAPESPTFTLNTATGISGGTNAIASGTEFVALGGSKVALIRMDKNALGGSPTDLTGFTPGLALQYDSTSGLICLAADANVATTSAMVVENDGATIVVLLA